jgi:hypothetical protein
VPPVNDPCGQKIDSQQAVANPFYENNIESKRNEEELGSTGKIELTNPSIE